MKGCQTVAEAKTALMAKNEKKNAKILCEILRAQTNIFSYQTRPENMPLSSKFLNIHIDFIDRECESYDIFIYFR